MTPIASKRRSTLAAALVTLTALIAAATTEAATITWGAATGITGDTDVSATGTLVGARNLGGTGVLSPAINGTTFTGLVVPIGSTNVVSGPFTLAIATGFQSGNFLGSAAAPFSTLSVGYQSLLNSGAGDFTTPFTLTMSGLTAGETYQLQWWANVSNGAGNVLTTATAGNSVSLGSNPSNANGGVGQFSIGTFIADNATQQITFSATNQSVINAFQLRQTSSGPGTAVPEPGSALVGAMVLGLCGARLGRRQRAAQVVR